MNGAEQRKREGDAFERERQSKKARQESPADEPEAEDVDLEVSVLFSTAGKAGTMFDTAPGVQKRGNMARNEGVSAETGAG